ncbi:PIG-L deacetylase family protein [Pseudonocardia sp. H11422]|uniref:PIG-L deacetylase family protein n=1 Tax=Pseudonocardia sp. H11422 TaxID=2835866 RepID=UPI001BDC3538|nr:PIG-L deacetylase family protein [Pseudonocardia sp. H11422]
MRVLVVAAHPDDEVLGPGGTILRHVKAGDEVCVLIACTGTNLRYDTDAATTLLDAAREVGELLGVRLALGDLPDQGLDTVSLPAIVDVVSREIGASAAEMVYVHHWGDINRDHRILSEATMVATRPYAAPEVRTIRCFETPSSTEWGTPAGLPPFVPTLFVDVADTLDAKIDAFVRYRSEVRPAPHPRSPEALADRGRHWGSVAGLGAAEPFVVARDRW